MNFEKVQETGKREFYLSREFAAFNSNECRANPKSKVIIFILF
jgi:hypothetical protein